MIEKRQILDNFILTSGESLQKINNTIVKQFCIEMSDIDRFGYEPTEDDEGKFFFEINENGAMVKFYQEEDIKTEFLKELIFRPKEDKSLELHIINDYE